MDNEQPKHLQPPDPRRERVQLVRHEERISYEGPLPPASELEQYERVCLGAADRIIVMAEQQAAHRRGLEQSVVRSNVKNESLGMYFSFCLTLLLMGSGFYMIIAGEDTAGYFAVFGPVVFHGGNYVFHKFSERRAVRPSGGKRKE